MSQRSNRRAGIIGWGVYVPPSRVDAVELDCHRALGAVGPDLLAAAKRRCTALGVNRFAVPSLGEDSTTMGIEASIRALDSGGRAAEHVEAVYLGSESRGEFKVRPTSTIIASYLGVPRNIWAKDIDGACAGGAMALEDCLEKVALGKINLGLALGTDVAFYPPGPAELTQGAAAVAFLVGAGEDVVAVPLASHCSAFHSDDFFRRNGQIVPHLNAEASKRAYLGLSAEAINGLLKKLHATLGDFDRLVFHTPYERMVWTLTREKLGLTQEEVARKVSPHLVAHSIGNTYAASSLCSLARALDRSRKGEKILLCSFGSGAVALAVGFEVVRNVPGRRRRRMVDYDRSTDFRHMSFAEYETWRTRYWELRGRGGTPFDLLCRVEPRGNKFHTVHLCSKCGLVQGIAPEPICSCDSCRGQIVNLRLPERGILKETVPVRGSPRAGLNLGLLPFETDCGRRRPTGIPVELAARIMEFVGADGPVCYGPAYIETVTKA